jgi:hypothetical protein
MVFNATFNNISVISLWSILLVEETRIPGENHRPIASHWQTLSHIEQNEMWNVIEMVAWKKISRNDSWTGFLICHNKFTKFTIFFATYWLLPTWWALHIRSKSCLFKNLLTTSPPNVNDTPLSFSPHPCTSLSGSDHNKSHNKPAIH